MASKAQENCGSCTGKLPKNGDCASCFACGNGFHLDKCSIKKQTWLSMGPNKQSIWSCASCRKSKKGSQSQAEEDNLTREPDLGDDEVSSLGVMRSILTKVNGLYEMKEQLNTIEASVKFLAERYDTLIEEISQLRAENKEMKAEITALKSKDNTYKEATEKLAIDVAEMDQYGRRLNLEIQGVKVVGDPREEIISEVLKKVAKDIDIEFRATDIHQAHRLGSRKDGKPPTIIVQFFSKSSRDQWLNCGRKARLNNIFFNENLSSYNRLLFKEAKIKAKTVEYKFVWFRGGRVLAKKGEHSNVIIIKCFDDLKKIK